MTLPPMKGYLWFHVVAQGSLWLNSGLGEAARLSSGDVALVPHGAGHTVMSEPDVAVPPILDLPLVSVTDRYETLRHGGGGARATLICAAVRLGHPAASELVAAMPPLIVVPARDALAGAGIHAALRLIADEARGNRPGGEVVLTRLADVLVIETIRAWLEGDVDARKGWLGALRDPQIGRAIAAVHRDPARAWTVESLSREAAMSRSAFAARFTEIAGEPPMRYVARWRMKVAVGWLTDGELTVGEAAHRLGYESEAAFNRAFKRLVGVAPGTVRRGQRELTVVRTAGNSGKGSD
jgi:AraC-like DNA-binding protein